jgi:hypothetical protein
MMNEPQITQNTRNRDFIKNPSVFSVYSVVKKSTVFLVVK